MMAGHGNRPKAFIFGFVVGAAAGAVQSLLNAPQSGQETRRQIEAWLAQWQTRAADMADQTRYRAAETMHRTQEDAQARLQRVEQQAWHTLEQAQERVQQAIERLESAS